MNLRQKLWTAFGPSYSLIWYRLTQLELLHKFNHITIDERFNDVMNLCYCMNDIQNYVRKLNMILPAKLFYHH